MEKVKNVLYRMLAIVLAVTVASGSLGGLTLTAEAAETLSGNECEPEPEEVVVEEIVQIDTSDLPDNEELFSGYMENVLYEALYGDLNGGISTYANVGADMLTKADEQTLYSALKAHAKKVAAGEKTSTEVLVSDLSWTKTAAELGVVEITDANRASLASQIFAEAIDTGKIIDYLLMDCPFDLYWYDKIAPTYASYSYTIETTRITVENVTIKMPVAAEYRPADAADSYTMSVEIPTSVETAKTTAADIVSKYASEQEYEKLLGFKEEICALTSYNTAAAEDSTTAYGNPWQLIWVFDGDSSTNVVCEGYSKAYQYLCDLAGLTCYTVTGDMNGGAHMWNVVTFGGSNYMVDITNCDSGTIGYPNKLFLAGTATGSVSAGYTFPLSYNVTYIYDSEQIGLFGTDILTLAAETFGKEPVTITFGSETQTLTYTGNEAAIQAPTVVGNGNVVEGADITYSYRVSESTGDYVTGLPVDAGVYEIKASVPDTTYYYGSETEKTLTLTIEKATPVISIKNYNPDKTYDGTAISVPAEDQVEILHGSYETLVFEWHKGSENGEIVDAPVEAGTYYLLTSLAETENTNPVTLSHVVTIKPSYPITYEVNGGVNNSANPSRYTADDTVTLYDPVKTNYIFEGWYLESDFSGSAVTDFPETKAEAVTLYARWRLNLQVDASIENTEFVCGYDTQSDYRDEFAALNVTVSTTPTGDYAPRYEIRDAQQNMKKSGSFDGDYSIDLSYGEFTKGTYTLQVFWDYHDGIQDTTAASEKLSFTVDIEKRDYPINAKVKINEEKSADVLKTFADIQAAVETELLKDIESRLFTGQGESASAGVLSIQTSSGEEISGDTELTTGVYKLVYTLDNPGNYFNETAEATLSVLYEEQLETTYPITYVLNGGTNSALNPFEYVWDAETFTLEAPTRTGYDFLGWYSDADFTSGDDTIERGTVGERTFYAKWARSYTITYKLNYGTNSSKNPATYNTESDFALAKPTRKGYTFKGWYTSSKYTTKVTRINAGTKGNKTFYAKWVKTKYSLTYTLNGGKLSTANPSSYYVTTATITLKNPTRTGYVFQGWYTESTYENKITQIPKGSTGSKKLYTKWAKRKYTITYYLNSGTNSASNPASYYITTSTITLKNPTRKGYTFKGWYTSSKYTTKVTKIAKGSTGSRKLYAKWVKTKYSITYKLNGGKNSSSNPASYYVTTSTITWKNPTRKGYTFKGWYSDSDYETKVTKIAKGSTGKKTLYAKWVKTKYSITYNLNGGTNSSSNPSSYYITTSTITLKSPTRKGYTFKGWYSDSKYKTKVTKIAKGSTGSKKLYAKWSANTYTIKFGGNGATSGSMSYMKDRKYGSTYTLSANKYKRSGWTFTGWNTKKDGSGTAYKNKASVKNLSSKNGGSITLYAQWKPNFNLISSGEYPVYTYYLDSDGNPVTAMAVTDLSFVWRWYSGDTTYDATIYVGAVKCADIDGAEATNPVGAEYVIKNSAGVVVTSGIIEESGLIEGDSFVVSIDLEDMPKGDYYIEFTNY